MNTATKVGAYTLGLIAAFGAAAGIGSVVGPAERTAQHGTDSTAGPTAGHAGHSPAAKNPDRNNPDGNSRASDTLPGGLMVSQDGYTLSLAKDAMSAGEQSPVAFRILGPDGQAVTDYRTTHDKDLHFIAVRRDLTGFQHVHQNLAADGTWATQLNLTPGEWRVFADFAPADRDAALTLGADVSVPGEYVPQPLPEASTTTTVDGYTVTLNGDLKAGTESALTLTVTRNGKPVTDLEPYLAAYGHLVALRNGDLAYLHVHPAGSPDDGTTAPGPDITFYATAPSVGSYRLFLDFKHGGQVRTAEFTVNTDQGTATAGEANAGGEPSTTGEPTTTGKPTGTGKPTRTGEPKEPTNSTGEDDHADEHGGH